MCAIFGIAGCQDASAITFLGLQTLQGRGQESFGVLSSEGNEHYIHRQLGLISSVGIPPLKGDASIGHTRYSTTGGSSISNIQPLCMKFHSGWGALAHNGNLINSQEWIESLEKNGAIFQTTTDTEIIMHLIAKCKMMSFQEAIVWALKQVEGAYSLLAINKDYLIAIRDPYGFRPLVYGQLHGKPVFASETCAFDLIGAKYISEVSPGEMISVNLRTLEVSRQTVIKPDKLSRCVFELIYFSRPDSMIFGRSVYEVRKALGRRLAQEQPVKADMTIPVPDSGIAAALGYAEQSGIPFEMGIIRSHYLRTFIQPSQSQRVNGVKLKLNAVSSLIANKKVVVVDDSLVRGTTSKKIINMLREAGAREIHMRISSPPTISSCHYGIDTPTKEELIASNHSVDYIKNFIEADSLGYLSINALREVTGEGFCNACFTNEYPTLIQLGRRDKVSR